MRRTASAITHRILLHPVPTPYGMAGLQSFFDANWLRTNAGLNDGDPVTDWERATGSGSPFTSIAPPTFQSNGGKPSLLFDGIASFLETDASFVVGQPFTIFCICRASALSGYLFEGPSVSLAVNASGTLTANAGTVLSLASVLSVGVWTAVAVVVNGAQSLVRATVAGNMQQVGGNLGASNITGGIRLGTNAAGTVFFAGDIAQFVCLTQPASTADLEAFEQYARNWTG